MLYMKDFLTDTEFRSLRRELHQLLGHCLKYLQPLSAGLVIRSLKCGGSTFCAGEVKVPLNPEDKGAIFHEIAHGFFESSVFHSKKEAISKDHNEEWGEAFAEAIRWLMESEHLPESEWLAKFEERRNKEKFDSDKNRAYRILSKCGKTPIGFVKFWTDLIAGFKKCQDKQDKKYYLYNRLS